MRDGGRGRRERGASHWLEAMLSVWFVLIAVRHSLFTLEVNGAFRTRILHDIIVPLFLTDDHALLVTGHVLADAALVQGLRRGPVVEQTRPVLLL